MVGIDTELGAEDVIDGEFHLVHEDPLPQENLQ
jgi:hypothetical protein